LRAAGRGAGIDDEVDPIDHAARAGFPVQPVDVLRDDGFDHAARLELCQRLVGAVRLLVVELHAGLLAGGRIEHSVRIFAGLLRILPVPLGHCIVRLGLGQTVDALLHLQLGVGLGLVPSPQAHDRDDQRPDADLAQDAGPRRDGWRRVTRTLPKRILKTQLVILQVGGITE